MMRVGKTKKSETSNSFGFSYIDDLIIAIEKPKARAHQPLDQLELLMLY